MKRILGGFKDIFQDLIMTVQKEQESFNNLETKDQE